MLWRYLFQSEPADTQPGVTVATMLAEVNALYGSQIMCWVYRRFSVKNLRGRISERQAQAVLELAAQAKALRDAVDAARAEAAAAPAAPRRQPAISGAVALQRRAA